MSRGGTLARRDVHLRLDDVPVGTVDRHGHGSLREFLSPVIRWKRSIKPDRSALQVIMTALFILYVAVFTYLADWYVPYESGLDTGRRGGTPD